MSLDQAGSRRDVAWLFAGRGLRAVAYGLQSVLLGLYLDEAGLRPEAVGLMLTATLVGSAALTMILGARADRWGRRRSLLIGSLMTVIGAWVFATSELTWLWAAAALAGTIFAGAGEAGPLENVESAILPQIVSFADRNRIFGWSSALGAVGVAVGALAAGMARWAPSDSAGYRLGFGASGVLVLLSALVLTRLSAACETQGIASPTRGLDRSRPLVVRLSALFALDSLAGGFVVQGFVVYWFHQRFGAGADVLGPTFFAVNLMKAVSYPAAARLADRFGLLPTMVFSHLPSNVLLILLPIMPTLGGAVAVLVLRHALAQMDVPTRAAYLVGIVDPDERTAALSVTSSVRMAAHAVSPSLAGVVWQAAGAATPFWLAGSLKAVYDIALYFGFRKVPPREES
ncbi:MAG TPA: MFS transporter [Anaerolineales bacterium]|nr:MFS transporter [Anaerolineales bacterium]